MVHGCDPWECKKFLCILSSNTGPCISAEMDVGAWIGGISCTFNIPSLKLDVLQVSTLSCFSHSVTLSEQERLI
jgi:hypothetical protein